MPPSGPLGPIRPPATRSVYLRHGKWHVVCRMAGNGRPVHVGSFADRQAAIAARDAFRARYAVRLHLPPCMKR